MENRLTSTDICKQGISSYTVAEAAAQRTQFNKEKSIGFNWKKKEKSHLYFHSHFEEGCSTNTAQGARESLLSLCTQIKPHRNSTASCQSTQL